MSIITSMQSWIETCPNIELVHLDAADESPTSCAVALTGNRLLKTDILGNEKHQYSFAFYLREYAQSDAERTDTYGMLQQLTDWVVTQNKAQSYPELPEGCRTTSVSVANMLLMGVDNGSNTALYQVQIQLQYEKRS